MYARSPSELRDRVVVRVLVEASTRRGSDS